MLRVVPKRAVPNLQRPPKKLQTPNKPYSHRTRSAARQTDHSTVTDLVSLRGLGCTPGASRLHIASDVSAAPKPRTGMRGLWFRPAHCALTWLRQVSLHRKPRHLARLQRAGRMICRNKVCRTLAREVRPI